ncbi:target of rapamycin complex 2 subunit MAPKAP1 isoform X2 [Halyomorpha halys]|uniref:target of rapamycin complex 2 subunit MAPKAP1 isoform X2 n=1 Tax=Halyomorpha halys TaxID=286706 RepID=UPI0034D2903A
MKGAVVDDGGQLAAENRLWGAMTIWSVIFSASPDLQFGLRRHRSNTAQRLEKMEAEKKKAANTIHVKWVTNPVPLSAEARAELFPRKDLTSIKREKQVSLLTELLAKFPDMPENPFKDYARMDGNAQVGIPTKKYLIFITMLNENDRKYPMEVVIISSAKILDLVGLICWKCTIEHPDITFKDNVNHYGLYIAEDDGVVDWDFPSLDSREVVSKFGFTYLALVERDQALQQDETYPILIESTIHHSEPGPSSTRVQMENQLEEDMNRIRSHIKAIGAPVYQSFNVYVLNKVRARSEIHLGVSGEKLEIFPVIQQRVSARLWGGKQRAETFSMEDVVSCDVIEHKSNNRSTFRLVYCKGSTGDDDLGTIKHRDFESETTIASDIVKKVNYILEVRQSEKRREYIASRERKSHRKKNFHLGPR